MNKVKIGKYIKELRERKGLTRTQVADKLGTTYKSILDWEKGVMPTNESLLDLANLYNVTVDDILECGTQITKEELYQKYPDYQPNHHRSFKEDKEFYVNYKERQFVVRERFKELVMLFRKRLLSRSEDLELRFLFDNAYEFTNYFYDTYDSDKDRYLCFIEVLNDAKVRCKTASEYYYEVRKSIKAIKKPLYQYPEFGIPSLCIIGDKTFKSLENWEKDFYLALFQNSDVVMDPSYHSSLLRDYEERYGEQYDKEKVIKRLMKYFINNGAVLNPWLYSFIERRKEEHSVLSTLEKLYLDYIKPLFIQFHNPYDENDTEYKYAYVENDKENRYLDDYLAYSIIASRNDDIDPMKLYEMLKSADEKAIVDFLYSLHGGHMKTEETEYRFKKSAIQIHLQDFYKRRDSLLRDEKKADRDIKQIKELEERLNNGETEYYEYVLDDISEHDGFDHWKLMISLKNEISYYQFLKKRNNSMTAELMKEIDNLSLKEIRDKYFKKEVVDRDE